MKQTMSSSQGIKTIEKAALILEEMKNSEQPLTLTTLSRKLSMSKNNLKKYLVSFVEVGFVTFDDETKTYDLGSKLIELGLYTLNRYGVFSIVDPFMLRIKNEIKHSSALAIWTQEGPVISKYQSSGRSINVEIELGYYPPLLKSSVGRCFASFLPCQYTQDIINEEIKHYDLDRAQVEKDLNDIRQSGFASRDKEVDDLPGSLSVACPIFNNAGDMVAAICILGFVNDLNIDEGSNEVQRLQEITKEISDQVIY